MSQAYATDGSWNEFLAAPAFHEAYGNRPCETVCKEYAANVLFGRPPIRCPDYSLGGTRITGGKRDSEEPTTKHSRTLLDSSIVNYLGICRTLTAMCVLLMQFYINSI